MKRQLIEWEKMFANVASITLISTSDKNITKKRKLQVNITDERGGTNPPKNLPNKLNNA